MKKLYILCAGIVLAGTATAQTQQQLSAPRTFGKTPNGIVNRHPGSPTTQTNTSIYVDYDYMDENYAVNVQGMLYSRYIWDMNMNYSTANGDTSLRYAVVDFSDLYDSYVDPNTIIPYSSTTGYTIDSVFVFAGHENNSGGNDTLICKIVGLDAGGYPQTSNVLGSSMIVTNTGLSSVNDWLTPELITFTPNLTLNSSQKFAVVIEYYGAPQDTFGLLAGFADLGPGNCPSIPALPNFAVESHYTQNSYRHDMLFAGPPYNIPLLPTAMGADTYYDCDGSASYNAQFDSENFIQNWAIWTHITFTGFTETPEFNSGLSVAQNQPNPFTGTTTINFTTNHGGDVALSVVDLTGKQVMETQNGTVGMGRHSMIVDGTNLAAGVYYYTLTVGEASITRKMVIAE